MLQTPVWTREDMAVAQDWELEHGNEGALIWTDLGPDLARMVCENPEVLGMLVGLGEEPGGKAIVVDRVRALVEDSTRARARAGERALAWARARAWAWAWAWAWAGARAWEGEYYA